MTTSPRSDDGTVAHRQMVEYDGAHTHEYLMADLTRARDVGAWIDGDEVSKARVMADQDATVEERMATGSSMGGNNHPRTDDRTSPIDEVPEILAEGCTTVPNWVPYAEASAT